MPKLADVIQIRVTPERRSRLVEKAKANGFESVQKFMLFMAENGTAKIEVK